MLMFVRNTPRPLPKTALAMVIVLVMLIWSAVPAPLLISLAPTELATTLVRLALSLRASPT